MRSLLFPLVLAFMLPVTVFADDRTHDVTPEDYVTLAGITEVALSPDGKQAAYCEGRWDKSDDSRKTDLWVVAVDGKTKPMRLTGDRANDRHPKWSADGKAVYFLSNRKREAEKKSPFDGSTQVWKVNADGGDFKAITKIDGGISGYDYAAKADAIYFTKTKDYADADDFATLREKFGKVEYGHGMRKISELHKLDLQTWRTERVIDDKRYIREFAVTPDGARVAMISAFDDSVVKSEGESRVDVWQGGKVITPPTEVYRAKASSPHAWLENLCWSPDGKKFAFTAVHDAYPAEIILGVARTEGWDVTRLNRDNKWEVAGYGRGLGAPLKWTNDALVGLSEKSGTMGNFVANGASVVATPKIEPSKNVLGFDRTESGEQSVLILSSLTSMPVLTTSLNTDNPLVDPNPHTKTWKLPAVQHITWKAPDGAEVGGVLELPFGYKKGDKLPLVVGIHGGPTTATKADQNFDPHNGRLYFAAKGYAVLFPNYRGSTGYGDQFVTDLIGRENDVEVKDILAGIQHLVKEGIADENRVGVMGWSNGGYLTNCLITLKDSPIKFKAASSGAGIVDTVSEWGFNDEPAYPKVFKKGLPWEQPDLYKKSSPTYGLGNVTTPTIIHVGGADDRCPPGHSRMLYRALKEYKNVPTELIVYTGEPHGLTKLSNRKAKMEWDLAWFEKYMK